MLSWEEAFCPIFCSAYGVCHFLWQFFSLCESNLMFSKKALNVGLVLLNLHLEITYLATSIKWFKIAKSSLSLNSPNRILISVNVSMDMFCLLIQDENASQKFFVIFQLKTKCSRDSYSFWQNVPKKGDSIILKWNNFPLYWYNNSPLFIA